MVDEQLWRKRFLISTLVRLAALAVFFLGIAIAYFDVVKPGGAPQIGAIVAILGALDALLAPILLRRYWRQQDAE